MTHIPQDDEPLIRFLQQHRPIPPATATPLEAQLMQLVAREPKRLSSKSILFWIIPGAIVAAGLSTWLGWKGSHPSLQMAVQPEELESFVVETWSGTIGETTQETNPEISWLMLEESDPNQNNKTNYK